MFLSPSLPIRAGQRKTLRNLNELISLKKHMKAGSTILMFHHVATWDNKPDIGNWQTVFPLKFFSGNNVLLVSFLPSS